MKSTISEERIEKTEEKKERSPLVDHIIKGIIRDRIKNEYSKLRNPLEKITKMVGSCLARGEEYLEFGRKLVTEKLRILITREREKKGDVHTPEDITKMFLLRIKLHKAMNNQRGAIKDFYQVLSRNQRVPRYYMKFGRYLVKHTKYNNKRALVSMNCAIKMDPTVAKFYFNRGNLLKLMHREEHKKDFKKAVRLDASLADKIPRFKKKKKG